MNISIGMILVLLFVVTSLINYTRRGLMEYIKKMMDDNCGKSDPEFMTKIEMKLTGPLYVVCHSDGTPVKDASGNWRTYTEKYDADRITRQLNQVGVIKT